jgi:hypothetical protein
MGGNVSLAAALLTPADFHIGIELLQVRKKFVEACELVE